MLLSAVCVLALASSALGASVPTSAFGARVVKSQASSYNLAYTTGMAASRLHKDVVWMITSDYNEPYIFAVDITTGNEVAAFNVSGAPGYDWEDLAYGPCKDDCSNGTCNASANRFCLYIADIGIGYTNSGGARNIIYMVREPQSIGDGTNFMLGNVSVVDYAMFTWSEGDSESLFITPDSSLYVMSKVLGGRAFLSQIPDSAWGVKAGVPLDEANAGVLKMSTPHYDPQGASLSPSGTELLIVGEQGLWYYSVPDMDFIKAVNTELPQYVATYIPVPDTECVAWDASAQGFYTFAKGKATYLYYYPRSSSTGVVG